MQKKPTATLGAFINHVDIEEVGGLAKSIPTLLHKPYLVKWSTGGGGKNV